MSPRLIFPTLMFLLAAAAFAYGIWHSINHRSTANSAYFCYTARGATRS